MRPFEKYRRIKPAKAKKLNKNRMNVHDTEQAEKLAELNRKISFLDNYKLTPLKDMQDALAIEEKTRAKVVIHCAGQQFTLNPEQSKAVLLEAHRCLMIERQQLIKQLEDL